MGQIRGVQPPKAGKGKEMKFTPERFVFVALVVAAAVFGYLYVLRPSQVVRNETLYVPTMSSDDSDLWWRDMEARNEREAMNERIDCLARRSRESNRNYDPLPC